MPPRGISWQNFYTLNSFDSERMLKECREEWQKSKEGGSGKLRRRRRRRDETEPLGLTVLASTFGGKL